MLDLLAIFAVILQVITVYMPVVVLSRLIMGFYCAITTGLIPSWIISMSPSFTSGIFGVFSQIAIALGMAVAYSMSDLLSNRFLEHSLKVRLFIAVPILCSVIHWYGLKHLGFDNV